jgi:CHASE2 domain-containing sensor protein
MIPTPTKHLQLSLFAALLATLIGLECAKGGEAANPVSPATRESDSPFVMVFIDAKTEKTLGPDHSDRSLFARAIEKSADSGAKGFILKFFIDKRKNPEGDQALARAMSRTKVLLEARLDGSESDPNDLPERFLLPGSGKVVGQPMSGTSGWIPLPELSAAAEDVGFVDVRLVKNVAERFPVIEHFRDHYVKSLCLCSVELALGRKATVVPGKSITLGDKTVKLDKRSEIPIEYPAKDDLQYISLVDFLNAKALPDVKDRIVIVGWDVETFEPIRTRIGKIRPHRLFYYSLLSLYRQLH